MDGYSWYTPQILIIFANPNTYYEENFETANGEKNPPIFQAHRSIDAAQNL
jgi:hypothetical protein